MNIGIDIDDTIVDTTRQMLKYADIYNKETFAVEVIKKELGNFKNTYSLKKIYGWNEEIKRDFYKKYYKKILEECTLKDSVAEVLTALKNEGNNIYFITARFENNDICNSYDITKNMLDKNNIPYNEIIVGAHEKLEYAKKYNIDVFVEDNLDTCVKLKENGIEAILMTSELNFKVDTGNIERVDNWFEAYLKINAYKNK